MKEDFVKIILAFFAIAILLAIIVPFGVTWYITCGLLAAMSLIFQWYWNKHFTNEPPQQ